MSEWLRIRKDKGGDTLTHLTYVRNISRNGANLVTITYENGTFDRITGVEDRVWEDILGVVLNWEQESHGKIW